MAVLIITMDDLIDDNPKWDEAFDLLFSKGLSATVGVITKSYGKRKVNWSFIESKTQSDLVEVASHSRTHGRLPFVNYASEIGGSKLDISENLGVEATTWICPHGRWNDDVLTNLGECGYLVLRGGNRKSKDFRRGDLLKVSHSIEIGDGPRRWNDVNLLNNHFDYVCEHEGVYHLMVHPSFVDWTKESYMDQHLDYILDQNVSSMTLGDWRNTLE